MFRLLLKIRVMLTHRIVAADLLIVEGTFVIFTLKFG